MGKDDMWPEQPVKTLDEKLIEIVNLIAKHDIELQSAIKRIKEICGVE